MCRDTFGACDLSGFISSGMCDVFKVSADLLMDLYIETFKLVLNRTNCRFHEDEPYENHLGAIGRRPRRTPSPLRLKG